MKVALTSVLAGFVFGGVFVAVVDVSTLSELIGHQRIALRCDVATPVILFLIYRELAFGKRR